MDGKTPERTIKRHAAVSIPIRLGAALLAVYQVLAATVYAVPAASPTPPEAPSPRAKTGSVEIPSPRWRSELDLAVDRILELLGRRAFTELEAFLSDEMKKKSLTPSGSDKLTTVIEESVERPRPRVPFDLEARLDEWCRTTKSPSLARTVLAQRLRAVAWEIRGGGWAADVEKESWGSFTDLIARSTENLQKAWEADPSNYVAACLMIRACTETGLDKPTMEIWFERVTKLNPGMVQAYVAKARFLSPKWHGTPEELMAFVQETVKTAPPGSVLHVVVLNMIEDFADLSRDHEAFFRDPARWKAYQEIASQLHTSFPKSSGYALRIARTARKAGLTMAMRWFAEAIERAPSDPEVLTQAAEYHLTVLGNEAKALEFFSRALESDPGDEAALRGRSGIMRKRKDAEQAHAGYRLLRVLKPGDAYFAYIEGWYWRDKGENLLALQLFGDAVRLAPENGNYLFQRGVCLARLGRTEAAVADYTQALELDRSLAKLVYQNRSECYQILGRHKEAQADAEALRNLGH